MRSDKTVSITDLGDLVAEMNAQRKRDEQETVAALLPQEDIHPIADRLKAITHAS